jgi:SecD/SecF fusion protein
LMHDLLITAGVYALFQREVTTSTVAALLTILGFSLYDTIIVFDRIRENVPRMPRATFAQIVNRSMSEVITRSLVTSLSTLLPIAALMFFGGETLRDFGFALLIGVASGTYSSIFIAAPVLTHWKSRETVWRRRERIVMEDHGGVIPAYADVALGDESPGAARRGRAVPARGRPAAAAATAGTAAAEPAAGATALEEPATPAADTEVDGGNGRGDAEAVTSSTPAGPRPRTPEARRAARRAARAAAQPKPDTEPADSVSKPAAGADADAAEAERAAKRAAANRRRKKHGRSR